MPYRKTEFANEEIYHTILRSIDGRLLFANLDDYFRALFSIYEFNDSRSVDIRERREARKKFKELVAESSKTSERPTFVDSREKLVDILAFCFMPNHIHLLLKQKMDMGIQKFMVKLGSGYGRYFNLRNQRKGYVFQNRFQSIHIEDDNQLRTVINYIHANPISLIEPKFKEEGIKHYSPQEVLEFLKSGHRWSSFPDYVGLQNFTSVTERDFITSTLGDSKILERNLMDWILQKKELAEYERRASGASD